MTSCQQYQRITKDNQLLLPTEWQNDMNYTPLHVVAHDKSLHHLIPKFSRYAQKDKDPWLDEKEGLWGCTALLLALWQKCSLKTLRAFLNVNANVTLQDSWGFNALHTACTCQLETLIIQTLISRDRQLINVQDKYGYTPLHCEVLGLSRVEVFNAMLAAGADIRTVNNDGMTLLHTAVKYNRKAMVERLLLSSKELLHVRDKWGRIPLHYCWNEKIVNILIQAGSSFAIKDRMNRTALHYCLCALNPSEAAVKAFLNNMSLDILEEINIDGNSLLQHFCAKRCSSNAVISTLIKAGLDPTKKNRLGNNALHLAVMTGHTQVCKDLIRGQPQLVREKNNNGKCPLELTKGIECFKEVIKWSSFQDITFFEHFKSKKFQLRKKAVWRLCQKDIKIMKKYRVLKSLSLYDLLSKWYLSDEDASSGLFWKQCFRALDFDASTLSVFSEEVMCVQRRTLEHQLCGHKLSTCSSEAHELLVSGGELDPCLGIPASGILLLFWCLEPSPFWKNLNLLKSPAILLITRLKCHIVIQLQERTFSLVRSEDTKPCDVMTAVKVRENTAWDVVDFSEENQPAFPINPKNFINPEIQFRIQVTKNSKIRIRSTLQSYYCTCELVLPQLSIQKNYEGNIFMTTGSTSTTLQLVIDSVGTVSLYAPKEYLLCRLSQLDPNEAPIKQNTESGEHRQDKVLFEFSEFFSDKIKCIDDDILITDLKLKLELFFVEHEIVSDSQILLA